MVGAFQDHSALLSSPHVVSDDVLVPSPLPPGFVRRVR